MIEACALAALCGVPVAPIVYGDALERELWVAITSRAADLKLQIMKAQAAHNAQQVSLLFRSHG